MVGKESNPGLGFVAEVVLRVPTKQGWSSILAVSIR